MIKRIFLLLVTKVHSLFLNSISFFSQVEYSTVSRKAKVWQRVKVFHSTIGDYSYVGPNCRIIHCNIGKFCSIAGDSAIGMGTHSLNHISTASIFTAPVNGTRIKWTDKQDFEEYKTINIGNDVWIGQRVLVIGGVTIGNGAVIGAGAVVTKDVPPYAVVGGVPAKVLKYRFSPDVIEALEKSEWWRLPDDVLRRNIALFQKPLDLTDVQKLIEIKRDMNL